MVTLKSQSLTEAFNFLCKKYSFKTFDINQTSKRKPNTILRYLSLTNLNDYMKRFSLFAFAFFSCIINYAQQKDSVTTNDYAHAEQFLFYNTAQKINRASVIPNWFGNDKFWYRILTPQGS